MSATEIYHTKSLVLRPVNKTDFEMIYKWENDQSNWIQSGVVKPYGSDEILSYVAKSEDLLTDGQTRFMIALNSGATIGCIDLFDFDSDNKIASVGLLVDEKYRQNGYGFEALMGLAFIAKRRYGLKCLKASVLVDNQTSNNLFKRSGYLADDTKAAIYTYNNIDYLQLTYLKQL